MPESLEDPKMALDGEVVGKFPWGGQRTPVSKPPAAPVQPAPERNVDVRKLSSVRSLQG